MQHLQLPADKVKEYQDNEPGFKSEAINMRGNPANKALIKQLTKAYRFTNEGQTLDFILSHYAELMQTNGSNNSQTDELKQAHATELQQLKTSMGQQFAQERETMQSKITELSEQLDSVQGEIITTADLERLKKMFPNLIPANCNSAEEAEAILGKQLEGKAEEFTAFIIPMLALEYPDYFKAEDTDIKTGFGRMQETIKNLGAGDSISLQGPVGQLFHNLKRATEAELIDPQPMFKNPTVNIPAGTEVRFTNPEFLHLLLDYCRRDPSKEFPFQIVTEAILKTKSWANAQQKEEQAPEGAKVVKHPAADKDNPQLN